MRQPFPIHLRTPRSTFTEQLDWLKARGCWTDQFNCWVGGPQGDHSGSIVWDFTEKARTQRISAIQDRLDPAQQSSRY